MTATDREQVTRALLERYGERSFAEEAEIHLREQPHALYQMLELAALVNARVAPGTAVRTFEELRGHRWSTAGGVLEAGRDRIDHALRDAGYPEGDAAGIATAVTDAALHLQQDHGGDLGGLREDAGHDPVRERELLRHFADVDDGVVDAFCREVQVLWDELLPFADKKALDAAHRLGLGEDAGALRRLAADDREYVRLVDALVRVRHDEHGYRELQELAGHR
ncbi:MULTISPECIES: hypothetical protein [Streptomycetaceae]|uniref:Uncharacterized protein n=1 Tax=Streptantibioticus cattleyicolor (strain ATCC 35852 / DSM 46488 / JCM 4925 / NBRC 14057 / NRRL 8057) TaxID=1003195 RepID=F8K0G8_STREN|nr:MULTISPECIES: hypothetical protein [Streptomycetaceae]AEW97370.1 hypothetical protein SCATT_49990 [Streptantibioticus cattleyicolor NRRL 8057 = DSM 46488]MYS61820.1 hypothetical protein [Streptomyces sp. SID5468]CCB77695.1 conserved protein of unknown function [Streptantibioticus cattleyicolor NRRL 8057 = DSM 46488]